MKKRAPYLANAISYGVNKRRFEMMVTNTSRSMKTLKLVMLLPIAMSILVMNCFSSKKGVNAPTSLSELTPTDARDYMYFQDVQLLNVSLMNSDIELYNRVEPLHNTEQPIHYTSELNRFSGTQNWLINDQTRFSQYFENGIKTRLEAYDENGTLVKQVSYSYDNDYSKTVEVDQSGNTTVLETFFDTYNGKPRTLKSVLTEGDVIQEIIQEYDGSQRTSIKLFENGQLLKDEIFGDELVEITEYYKDGDIKSTYQLGYYDITLRNRPVYTLYEGLRTIYSNEGEIITQDRWEKGELIEKIK